MGGLDEAGSDNASEHPYQWEGPGHYRALV